MKYLRYAAVALVLIGALNWGLIGFFGFNLVSAIFGDMTILSRIIYSLVGVGAIVTMLTPEVCENFIEHETCECETYNL